MGRDVDGHDLRLRGESAQHRRAAALCDAELEDALRLHLLDDRLALVFNESSAAHATARRLSLYDEIDDDGIADTPGPGTVESVPACTGSERTAFWGAPRAPMTLAVSTDAGLTWPTRRNIEEGDGYCLSNNSRDALNRELSYPSICADGDSIHVAFTRYRQAIEYVALDDNWAYEGAP